jgi:hypothetical protein
LHAGGVSMKRREAANYSFALLRGAALELAAGDFETSRRV